MGQVIAVLLLLLLPTAAGALGNWEEPHPWRRQALLEGRRFDYDSEGFLQYFSFRHLSSHPASHEDGVAGTVGSVTSDRALVDFRFRKRFVFDGERQSFLFQADRSEDFDGYYDRQLVGFSHRPTRHWRLAIRGDVRGDKAESDIWFQGEWLPGNGNRLWLALILPDLWFNEKTDSGLEYREQPRTFFGQWQTGGDQGTRLEINLNHSPAVTIVDTNTGLEATGDQTRAMVALGYHETDWHGRLEVRGESTSRHYDFGTLPAPPADEFDREMHSATLSLTLDSLAWQPQFGLHHLRMREQGWFGTASGSTGEIVREEPLAWAQVTLPGGPRHHWEPALYISRPRIHQQVQSPQWHDRDTKAWRAKIAFPWRYVTDADAGGVITITPSLQLHQFGFGGGNVQLHWPL